MSRRKSSRVNRQPDVDELGQEDGSDPKKFHDKRQQFPPGREPGRKAWQLCGQVQDALRGILASCSEDRLQNLMVISVEPAPNTGRLMVTVADPVSADAADRTLSYEAIHRALGLIRVEVAAAVNRRKAPELVFRVV